MKIRGNKMARISIYNDICGKKLECLMSYFKDICDKISIVSFYKIFKIKGDSDI